MKLLIMCEGANELELVNILLTGGLLTFTEDDLLDLTAFHARQIGKSAAVSTALSIYPGRDVVIYRIGDKQNEKLKIPKEFADKIIGIEKFCTKPELEMLLIISEGLTADFEKNKSSVSPKVFAKANICFNGRRYDNSTDFYREYYAGRPELLVAAIREYRRIRSHARDERYLAELLR